MELKFLHNEPVALWKDWVVVSDLHIGGKGGRGWKAAAAAVREIMEREGRKKLVVAGDVKDKIRGVDGEAGKFIREIGSEYELHITKGNHDGMIEKYEAYCTVHGAGGAVFDGLGCFHGHAWPDAELLKCRMIVCGHGHPTLLVGKEIKKSESVWVKSELDCTALRKHYGKDAVIKEGICCVLIPPFKGGCARYGNVGCRSPLKNIFIKSSAQIYLLNGIRIQ